MKRALITGISGQDGSYLAEHLVSKGYQVYGLIRRPPSTCRHLENLHPPKVTYLFGDLRDQLSLEVAIRKSDPDEIYNLGGQVFVPTSWSYPADTFDVNTAGLARILDLVKRLKPEARVYQASTSEMFGNWDGVCSEATEFKPCSPYGVSKVAAHRLAQVYREAGMYVACGILFNHESPRRGEEMVTRKIVRAIARWALGGTEELRLGNLDARRDWGFAGDYVQAMHLMLQVDKPEDFVVGTGESHSVKEFFDMALDAAALLGYAIPGHRIQLVLDSRLARANEIKNLRADASRALRLLNWYPSLSFHGLVSLMLRSEIEFLGGGR